MVDISLLWRSILLVSLTSMGLSQWTTTKSPCHLDYDGSLDICGPEGEGNTLWLEDKPLTLTTPMDPMSRCKTYRAPVTCTSTLVVRLGQMVKIETGENYQLSSPYCRDCSRCDSFTIDQNCVTPSLSAKTRVMTVKKSEIRVKFTSYRVNSADESQAQLKFTAFGCPIQELIDGGNIRVDVLPNTNITIYTPSYKSRVSCENDHTIRDQEISEKIVECKRRLLDVIDEISYKYEWQHDGLLTCEEKGSLTVVVAAISAILFILLVILIILCCLRKLPCQRNRDEETSESSEESAPMNDQQKVKPKIKPKPAYRGVLVTARQAKLGDDGNEAMKNDDKEDSHINSNNSNNRNFHQQQARITNEVANYWNTRGSGTDRTNR